MIQSFHGPIFPHHYKFIFNMIRSSKGKLRKAACTFFSVVCDHICHLLVEEYHTKLSQFIIYHMQKIGFITTFTLCCSLFCMLLLKQATEFVRF